MNKDGRGIVLFSTADWDAEVWTNKQHVALSLRDAGFRVLYIESAGLRRPTMEKLDAKRIARRLYRVLRTPRLVSQNLLVWSPPSIPLQSFRVVRRFNQWATSNLLWMWVRRTLDDRPILWTYNPLTMDLLEVKRFSSVVYHCVDDISAQPLMPADVIRRAEARLIRAADVVSVTSPALAQHWRGLRPDLSYYPNCIDPKLFEVDVSHGHQELARVPRPIIGFVGYITSYKINVRLLKEMMESKKDWTLVMVGPVDQVEGDGLSELMQLANVRHLGRRPAKDVPILMRQFSVGIIPALKTRYTEAMFPMKFFEYLAAGVPVVSTDISSLVSYGDIAHICPESEFIESVERAISEPKTERKQSEIDKALEQNTYLVRTEKILSQLTRQSPVALGEGG